MEPGILSPSRYLIFRRDAEDNGILSRLFDTPEVDLTGDPFGTTQYRGWVCQNCRLILFDYSDPRAGLGQSLLDRVADGIDGAFEALDRKLGGWTTEEENQKQWDKPDEPEKEPENAASGDRQDPTGQEKPKKPFGKTFELHSRKKEQLSVPFRL